MREKKIRALLLILAISLSSGLLFGTLVWSDSFATSLANTYSSSYEGRELYISSNEEQPFFTEKDIVELGIKDLIPEIRYNTSTTNLKENADLNIVARDTQYNKDITLLKGKYAEDGNNTVISLRVSDRLKLTIGDVLKYSLNGKEKELNIVGICENKGIFSQDKKTEFTILVPHTYMSSEMKVEGMYNFVRANPSRSSISESIKIFNNANTLLTANQIYSQSDINRQVSKTVSTYYIMMIFVILVSMVIIQGAKKLVISERVQTIGTFFSQGASRFDIKKILYLESLIEGILGGIIGIGIGYAFCYFISYNNSPLKEYGIYEKVNLKLYILIVPVIFAIIMSLIACYLPIRSIGKMSVINVILNNPSVNEKTSYKVYVAGLIVLCIGLVFTFMNSDFATNFSIGTFLLTFVGMLILFPKVVQITNYFIFKLLDGRGGAFYLVINNLKTSKLLMTNTRLLIIAMTSIMIIFTISDSVKKGIVGIYNDLNYDVTVTNIGSDNDSEKNKFPVNELISDISKLDYVNKNSIVQDYSTAGELNGLRYWIFGVDINKYEDFNTYLNFKSDDIRPIYNEFKSDYKNGIIISTEIARKLNCSKNSSIIVKINNIEKEYKVIGIIDTKMFNMGYCVFMAKEEMIDVFHADNPSTIYINGSGSYSHEKLKEMLKESLKIYGVRVQTKEEYIEANMEENSSLIDNIKIFGMISLVICILGVLNNLTISFIQRKRELAVLGSVGLNSGQRGTLLFFESIFSSCWAALFSIGYLFIAARICGKVTRLIGMGLDVIVNTDDLWMYGLLTVTVGAIATVSVLSRSRKLAIINEIRYE